VSRYLDKVSILKHGNEVLGFKINEKEFYVEEDGHADVNEDELKGFSIGSIPPEFSLRPLDGITIVFEGEISSDDKGHGIAYMGVESHRRFWDYKFGAGQFYNTMKEAIALRKKTSHDVHFSGLEDDGELLRLSYEILLKQDMSVDRALKRFKEIVDEIEGHTVRLLEREEISPKVLLSEEPFTNEVLLPLFRTMGLNDVHYNHGKREFVKDITFSDIDKFGVRRNYGVQVKAGNMSGEAKSTLDKIIGQVDDAFDIPYVEVTSRERRYISTLIIAMSGRFTDNAKDKIMAKVGRRTV